jgi:heat-inducible transcriptional repressor
MSSGLDPRKQTILRAVVVEYVAGAEPVGSEQLVQRYGLGVKSATVRNELAEMSELGYLEQPHTSAGRIPSDLGYRFFVDRLVVRSEVEQATQQKLRGAAEGGDVLEGLLRDTVRVLSRVTHLLGVATTVRDPGVTVRTAVVSALGPSQALMVLALSNGQVENRMIECPGGLTLTDLGMVNETLARSSLDKTLKSLVKAKTPPFSGTPAAEKLMGVLWNHIRTIAREGSRGLLVTEGEEFMLAQPEFQRDVASLQMLLHELADSDVLYDALAPGESVREVTIGRENRVAPMQRLSVIRHSFFVGGTEAGVIALVGPTRMSYDKGMPLVAFTAQALSESLTRYLGR